MRSVSPLSLPPLGIVLHLHPASTRTHYLVATTGVAIPSPRQVGGKFPQFPLPSPVRWGVRALRTQPCVSALPSSQLSCDLCVLPWLQHLEVILVGSDQLVPTNNLFHRSPMRSNQGSWSSAYGTCRSKSLA
jgi:hypothetical protein